MRTRQIIGSFPYLVKKGSAKLLALSGFILCMMLSASSRAQDEVSEPTKPSYTDSVNGEKLVALAMDGPMMKEAEHQSKVYEYQLKNAKNSWMNLLTLSANYNDQTFKAVNSNTAYVYPKYFFGLNIPLGTILSRTPVKAANEAVEIGLLQQEDLKRKIRADVLTKYRQYRAQGELIALETGLMNDVEAALNDVKEKFRKNEIAFDAVTTAQRNRNDEQTRIINLKLQQDLYKLELERMIGTSLENALK